MTKQSLQLDKSPHQILVQMAASINFPSPPPPPHAATPTSEQHTSIQHQHHSEGPRNDVDEFIWAYGGGRNLHHWQQHHRSPSSMDRDVLHFLQNNLDIDHIKQRKLERLNANAAALVARRAFQFLAIDGTGLKWSSASLAICLSRLTSLHEEHQSKLRKSFYPFRIILSSDEFLRKIDVYGGTIRLNPAATSLQWLGTLSLVDDATIHLLKKNQSELNKNLTIVEQTLGLRAVKGYTCNPEDYYRCVKSLAWEVCQNVFPGEGKSLLAVSRSRLVVESDQVCRRAKLRKDGTFEVGASMDLHMIAKLLSEYSVKSNELIHIEAEKRARCLEMADRFMYEFGVQRVDRVSSNLASDQMAECLSMLLNKDEAEKEVLHGYLAGQSVGIAGRGQVSKYCQLLERSFPSLA